MNQLEIEPTEKWFCCNACQRVLVISCYLFQCLFNYTWLSSTTFAAVQPNGSLFLTLFGIEYFLG